MWKTNLLKLAYKSDIQKWAYRLNACLNVTGIGNLRFVRGLFLRKMIHLGMQTFIVQGGILIEARWTIDAGGTRCCQSYIIHGTIQV